MNRIAVVSAARTPIGKFLGALSPLSAVDLGAHAVRAAVQRAAIQPRAGRMIRAKVLGTHVVGNERRHYLDRLVHPAWVNQVGRYRAEGAVSTILIEGGE